MQSPNLISLKDGNIKDFTAGQINDEDARNIIDNLKIKSDKIELYAGQSCRNLLIFRNAKFDVRKLTAYEPHENIGTPIKDIFLETGLLKIGEDQKNYYVQVISLGSYGFSNPTHKQYSNFFIDKAFAQSTYEKIILKDDDKKSIHPSDIFVRYLVHLYK